MIPLAAYETLNDLISTHRDRIADYEKAMLSLKPQEAGLSTTFSEIIKESQQCIRELTNSIRSQDASGTVQTQTQPGKIYDTWVTVKTNSAGNPTFSILDTCERNEDALLKAYAQALGQMEILTPAHLTLLNAQQFTLKTTHDLIRDKRNAYRKLVNNNQII